MSDPEKCPTCGGAADAVCTNCRRPQQECSCNANHIWRARQYAIPKDRDGLRGQLIIALHDADVETEKGNITCSGDFADFLEERLPWLFAIAPQET